MTLFGRTYSMPLPTPSQRKINVGKWAVWTILVILTVDAIYSAWYGINLHTRDRCVIYHFLPRWLFIANEYLLELFMVVVAGAFVGAVTEKYFNRFRKFLPRNQVTAFLYASLIPVCSCSAIPLIESMKHRLPLRTLITFVVAAPLLNPYIIILSYTVLGVQYGTLRIVLSFVVAILAGWVVEWAFNRSGKPEIGIYKSCDTAGCGFVPGNDVYRKTWKMMAKIGPYILIAGILGLLFEMTGPARLVEKLQLNDSFLSLIVISLIGIPIYFCNGADVLFLSPLLKFTDLGMGNALAFSLTSTAVCISSIVMLTQFIGKRLTAVLVAFVFLSVISLSYLVSFLPF